MLSAHLEDRFRDALGEGATEARSDSIRFAVEFTRMLARVVPEQITDSDLGAMRAALEVRAELSQAEIDLLLSMALAPEHRADVGEDELRAFGSRFGRAEEEALRMAVAEELDLHAFSEKYGPAEALLLLDSLFGVCAVDGQIDGGEISRLQRAASELGVDPMLVGALFRKHDVRHANGDFAFDLTERTEWIISCPTPRSPCATPAWSRSRTAGAWSTWAAAGPPCSRAPP